MSKEVSLNKSLEKFSGHLEKFWPALTLHILEAPDIDTKLGSLLKKSQVQKSPYKNPFTAILNYHPQKAGGLLGIISRFNIKRKNNLQYDALIVLRPNRDEEPLDYDYLVAHHMWHVFNLTENIQEKGSFSLIQNNTYVPQNNQVDFAKINFEGDIFAGLFLKALGRENAIRKIAQKEAKASLSKQANFLPELYPFVTALNLTEKAYELHKNSLKPGENLIEECVSLTSDISENCGMPAIHTWQEYCSNAQELVWNKAPIEKVLGAAIDLSPNPEIRMCAYQVSELLNINVPRLQKNESWYNPFANEEDQKKLYLKHMDHSFSLCMEKAIKSGQGQPFFDLAKIQNERLAQGIYFGWCAPCLQAVGKYINNGSSQGSFPQEIAKMNFVAQKKEFDITEVRQLAKLLMYERRKGKSMDIERLHEFIKEKRINKTIKDSVKETLIYLNTLEQEKTDPEADAEIKKSWEKYIGDDAGSEIKAL